MDAAGTEHEGPAQPEARAARLRGLIAANVGTLIVLALLVGLPGEPEEARPNAQARATLAAAPPASPRARPERPAVPPRAIDAPLTARIRAEVQGAIERARKGSAGKADGSNVAVAVHVREAGVPGELVALRADRAQLPASNMKLVTSAAALVSLGPDWQFTTRFEAAGPLEGGVLRGDLVVRAGADPLYDPEADGGVRELLAPVVAELRAAGLRRVAGDLVLDEGGYLAPEVGPSWPGSSQHWQEYCARSGGFSANAGCLTAVVEARRPGERAGVSVRPRDHGLERRGSVTTRAARTRLSIAVEARPPTVTVRGELPIDVPRWSTRFAHPDPVELFGHALSGALAEGGVALDGVVRRERGVPPGARLAVLRSPLLGQLRPINTDSNNAVADQVFLALGAAVGGGGDRAGGARAVRAALERLGVPTGGLVQVDGSGLSREDRVAARQVTALIDAVLSLDDARAAAFVDSLAVAGERGTLDDRMKKGPARGRVHAKTGWISGASALSGVVDTLGGRRLVFSILVGYPRVGGLNTSCWKPMQDRVCELLAEWEPHG